MIIIRPGAGLALPLKTGQTTQYGGYADDGSLERGLSKAYVILTTGQYSGTTAITLNAKTDNHSNNVVYDRRTRLFWSRYVSGSIGPGSDGLLPWTTNGSGEGIFPYAAQANAQALGGYTDWRVPNAHEMHSLSHYGANSPAIDTTTFPSFPGSGRCWTSTTADRVTTNGITFVNADGTTENNSGKTANHYVLLVRGGRP